MQLLIDCNNFFVSCERVFRPDLRDKPVAVMSSNDGCIVARSNEVKALGIPMGVPVFQVRDIIRRHTVTLFSSNFALYGDMSNRVMSMLMRYSDDVDIYSIDEAFLQFDTREREPGGWERLAHTIRADILRATGIPVSIGIAQTKTLAKVASERAKKGGGVFSLLDPEVRLRVLAEYPIGEVWNIGCAHTRRLIGRNVTTAGAFCAVPTSWIARHMGIGGLRTYYELIGMACFGEMGVPQERKSIMSSRSFGIPTKSFDALYEALAGHTAEVMKKARCQESTVRTVSIMIMRRERGDDLRYTHSRSCEVGYLTDDTRVVLKLVRGMLGDLFIPGARYIKAGVLISGLMPYACAEQPTLFAKCRPATVRDPLFVCMDTLNRTHGRGTIRFAVEPVYGREQTAVAHKHRSPAYTTGWSDVVRVR